MGMTYAEAGRRITARELALWRVAERLTGYAAMGDGINEGRHQLALAPLLGGETVTLKPGEYTRTRRRRKKEPRSESVLLTASRNLGLRIIPRESV